MINYLQFFTTFGIIVAGLLIIISFIGVIYKKGKNVTHMITFPSYMSVLQYFMDKAFDIIHKERILIYSLEGMRTRENEIDAISKDFINLSLKLMGPSIQQELINLFGTAETLYFFMGSYFNDRYEDDAIRETAQQNIMEQETE